MSFDPTQPSSSSGTLANAIDGTRTNLVDLNTRLAVVEGLGISTTQTEVTTARGVQANLNARLSVALDTTGNITELVTARGGQASLNARLSVAMDTGGNITEVVTARGSQPDLNTRLSQCMDAYGNLNAATLNNLTWLASADVPTYTSASTFTVPLDRTGLYVVGLALKLLLGTTPVYSVVSNANYSVGSGLTTITLLNSNLTNALSSVYLGVGKGAPGAVWYNGAGVPSSGVGINGDYYLNNTNGDIYNRGASTWDSPIANITGPSSVTVATGTANAVAVTISGKTASAGTIINIQFAQTNTSPTPNLALNGGAALTITTRGGLPLWPRDYASGMTGSLTNVGGTTWELANPLAGSFMGQMTAVQNRWFS